MEKVRYMISDAANIVNVESHVLRYWEDELALNIPRNEMGHRYYTKENIQEFQKIKELKEQGYQLKAIRMIVHNGPLEGLTAESLEQQPAQQQMATQPQAVLQSPQQMVTQPQAQTPVSTQVQPQAALQSQQSIQPQMSTPPQATLQAQPLASTQVQEVSQSILDNTDKMAQFTDLMSQIVGKAIEENNEALSQNISEEVGKQVIKEMNYLMREREELEEERFRKLDAAIRGSIKKKDEGKKIWKKKKPSQP